MGFLPRRAEVLSSPIETCESGGFYGIHMDHCLCNPKVIMGFFNISMSMWSSCLGRREGGTEGGWSDMFNFWGMLSTSSD